MSQATIYGDAGAAMRMSSCGLVLTNFWHTLTLFRIWDSLMKWGFMRIFLGNQDEPVIDFESKGCLERVSK